ncbi:MAG: hypothetical protein KF681_09645 [Bdellovibrionaceae bacterium]|nr:hypothetical protein [Pseudobdellovibrionaceae bacterium]
MLRSALTPILFFAVVGLVPTEGLARQTAPKANNNRRAPADPVEACIQKGNAIPQACSTKNDNQQAADQSNSSTETGREIQQSSNTNVSDMCNQSGQNAQAAGSTLDRIGEQCKTTYDECKSSCQTAQSRLSSLSADKQKKVREAKEKCDSAESLIAGITSERGNATQAQQRAQQCKSDAGQGQMPQMPQMPQSPQEKAKTCQENPNTPECFKLAQDCSNPEFSASNEVCKCLNGGCGPQRQAGTNPDQGDDYSTGGLSSAGGGGFDSAGGGGNPGFESAYGNPNITGGGGATGGARSGGSSDAGSGEEFTVDEPKPSVLAGAGGSGLVVPQGAGTVSGGSYSNSGSWIPPKMNESNIDVDKFRPAANGRGLASDAPRQIHGPHVNMWHQISLRYISLKATLKP